MQLSHLTAISPLDGRYSNKTTELRHLFSEYALMHHRVIVEIAWIKHLAQHDDITEIPKLDRHCTTFLDRIIENFALEDAAKIKEIEATTNHDVKAVEYFLKDIFTRHDELKAYSEFVHFACTSEDINNLAYGLMLKKSLTTSVLPSLKKLHDFLSDFAREHASQAMLSRTHGQSATPTTVGKEIANFSYRLQRQLTTIGQAPILGKFNGAVGNFNAHYAAYPQIDWLQTNKDFVESLGLSWSAYTTQIEPHDYLAEHFNHLSQINTILIDLSRDIWGYISLNYFQQKTIDGEIGSSTMPHKVNPIDFENAEGNLSFANAIFQFLSQRLPQSRWQRDLVDSTLLRNIGVAIAHSLLAYKSLQKGLDKLTVAKAVIDEDLNQHWEIVAEAIQTVLRRHQVETPYEQLKLLTRGKKITQQDIHQFLDTLPIDQKLIEQLRQITPHNYTGIAEKLTHQLPEI